MITQPALDPDVWSSSGSSLWIGITIVCVKAALRPPKHSATTAMTGLGAAGDGCDEDDEDTGSPGMRWRVRR